VAESLRGSAVGLPPGIIACLFDLDGVLTSTAELHALAWKTCFDEYLARRAKRTGAEFRPFDLVSDYDDYVDGKPRLAGARSFLRSRGIDLPEGSPADPVDAETLYAIANAKTALVESLIAERGVRPYPGSVRFVEAVLAAGLRTAVVSSSAHARTILAAAGLANRVDVVVDGEDIARRGLAGKPAPDTFLAAAGDLGVTPSQAAVFEDAQAGVAAGRAGRFGVVVGVDRAGQAEALLAAGADLVVTDLAELLGRVPSDGGDSRL
jgi:beta-phosphoglucomutase family hydrolase